MSEPPPAGADRPRVSALAAVGIIAVFVLVLNWLVEWRGQPPEPTRNPPLPFAADDRR